MLKDPKAPPNEQAGSLTVLTLTQLFAYIVEFTVDPVWVYTRDSSTTENVTFVSTVNARISLLTFCRPPTMMMAKH